MNKEHKNDKPQWKKPELLVLTRNDPQEAVLGACKNVVQGISGPTNTNTDCLWTGVCGGCNDAAAS